MSLCRHPTYKPSVRMSYVSAEGLQFRQLVATLEVSCGVCGELYVFRAPAGFSTEEPMTDYSGTKLRIPCEMPPVETPRETPEDDELADPKDRLH